MFHIAANEPCSFRRNNAKLGEVDCDSLSKHATEDEGAGSYGVMEYILAGEATLGPQLKQG